MTTTTKYHKYLTPLQETNRRNQVASWANRRGLECWRGRALQRGKEVRTLKSRIVSLEKSRDDWKAKLKAVALQQSETTNKLNDAEQQIAALKAELAQKNAVSVSQGPAVLVPDSKKKSVKSSHVLQEMALQ